MSANERLSQSASSFRRVASSEFDRAVKALIALAFRYAWMGDNFMWERDPELFAEATRICRGLSDSLASRAKAIAKDAVSGSFGEAGEYWDSEASVLDRFDQEGSHLLELLAIWVALAFVNSISEGELRVLVSRYLANPFASPLWRGLPFGALGWGRGYSRNILEQVSVIGQNAIVAAYRRAEWERARSGGAVYYIRRRGSGYDCPDCDSMCGFPIPIDTPFEWLHSRCMCWPEYHYDKMPDVQV